MTRKLFKLGGLDVTLGKAIAAGVVLAGLATGTCAVRSCGYKAGRNSVVNSDARVSVDHDTVESAIKRLDTDNEGRSLGSTEYTVTAGPNEQTQVLEITRYGGKSVVYTDSNLLDEEVNQMDGRVDEINFPELGVTLIREHDYSTNTRVFNDADADLKAAKARFGSMD
ncbi:MAG: hypothetical protein KJ955_03500 [Nanoarchaeota archaeon]|nr:hypothetical protein [Nanoarchaeota archaeon]